MTSDSFRKFLQDIQSCSDNRLREIYTAVVDEMDDRSWEKNKVDEVAEALSDYQYDHYTPEKLSLYGIENYEQL